MKRLYNKKLFRLLFFILFNIHPFYGWAKISFKADFHELVGKASIIDKEVRSNKNGTSACTMIPVLQINAASLTLFTYAEGQGPSPYQTIQVSGQNMEGELLITCDSNWEVSTNQGFTNPQQTLVLTPNASNVVVLTNIYIRLKSNISQGSYSGIINFQTVNSPIQSFSLSGEVSAPVGFIDVKAQIASNPSISGNGSGTNVSNPLQNTQFATLSIGDLQTKSFLLENSGGVGFQISSVNIEGANPSDFSISLLPQFINAKTTISFTITFSPNSMGEKNAIIHIRNTSTNVSEYRFNVRGNGRNGEVEVRGNSMIIINGSSDIKDENNTRIGFSNINTSYPTITSKNFTIYNRGNDILDVTSITTEGQDAGSFVIAPSVFTIPIGGSREITISFQPDTIGIKNAIVVIQNSDRLPNKNPYRFLIQGIAGDFISCSPNEKRIYETGFESPEFTSNLNGLGAIYNNSTPYVSGPSGNTWSTYFGTPSQTGSITEQQSLQMRLYATQPSVKAYSSMDFDVSSAIRLEFKAISTGNLMVRVLQSVDQGVSYNNPQEFNLSPTISAVPYQYQVSSLTTNQPIRFKFELVGNAPASGSSRLIIDDVVIFAFENNIKEWNGTSWSGDGQTPKPNQKAIILNDYSTKNFGNFQACSCEIKAGANLIVGDNEHVVIHNALINNGNVLIENNANLVQTYDVNSNIGEIRVIRNAMLKKGDYNYWASPVLGQNLKSFSPDTSDKQFLTYNEWNDFFTSVNPLLSSFQVPGKGYAIGAPSTFSSLQSTFQGTFIGVPNNGFYELPLFYSDSNHGYNLIGNPYPSNINIEKLFSENKELINSLAYFWTNINPNGPMQGSSYPKDGLLNNYSVFNGTGGVVMSGTVNTYFSMVPNVKIGQGFIVKAKKPGNLIWNNSMRNSESNSMFINKVNQIQKDRFWLQLKTPLDVVSTILIGYVYGSSKQFELDFDAPLVVKASDALYTILNAEAFAIEGRGLFDNDDEIPLGMSFYEDGLYEIAIKDREGVFTEKEIIFLKDRVTSTITKLSNQKPYRFFAKKGVEENRWSIVFRDSSLLTDDIPIKSTVDVYKNGTFLVLKSKLKPIQEVLIFNVVGQLLYQGKPNKKNVELERLNSLNDLKIIVLKIDNEKITRKIFW